MTEVIHALQHKIKQLTLVLAGEKKVDITNIFHEINIYDNVFSPVMTGKILVQDAVGLYDRFFLKGEEKIIIDIEKGVGDEKTTLKLEKIFSVYKISDRKNINQTSQAFIIHFVTEEFLYSQQKKSFWNYLGEYSGAVKKILVDDLKVENKVSTRGKSGINLIEDTSGSHTFNLPNLTPFEAINWISKRSLSKNYETPDMLFFENRFGYNFVSLSTLLTNKENFNIYFNPKNLDFSIDSEFFSARNMKVLSDFNLPESIKNGVYGGKFIGFDTLSKTFSVQEIQTAYELSPVHANANENLQDKPSKSGNGKTYKTEKNSRIVIYPFSLPRTTVDYIKTNSTISPDIMDDTQNYIFQRKSLFYNLLQKRIQLVMPGHFGYYSGNTVKLNVPRYSYRDSPDELYDETLTGKYVILGTRHIIKYDSYETVIEVATDSITRKK